jgi:hypothetical protein
MEFSKWSNEDVPTHISSRDYQTPLGTLCSLFSEYDYQTPLGTLLFLSSILYAIWNHYIINRKDIKGVKCVSTHNKVQGDMMLHSATLLVFNERSCCIRRCGNFLQVMWIIKALKKINKQDIKSKKYPARFTTNHTIQNTITLKICLSLSCSAFTWKRSKGTHVINSK